MSKTLRKNRHEWNDDRRPEWQQNRGPRFGNQRRKEAALKVMDRRIERARNTHQLHELLEEI